MSDAVRNPAPHGVQLESGLWEDEFGGLGPFKPGEGPRQVPTQFPTGPAIGERFPDVVAPAHTGDSIDVRGRLADGAAVVVFYRSAVW